MDEIELHQTRTKAWLENWINENESPNWLDWFGCYPAKASVNAAKAQLKAMDANILISTEDSLEIFKGE